MAGLTHADLLRALHYEPATGIWSANVPFGRAKPGDRVDAPRDHSGNPYYRVRTPWGRFFSHRLAWFYVTGRWPSDDVDHRDRARSNNRWENLREATRTQNAYNSGPRQRNTSGHRGVHWHRGAKKWRAMISIGGKDVHLGYFEDVFAAAQRVELVIKRTRGEFARA